MDQIIKQLFTTTPPTPSEIEKRYPPRQLPVGAMVTRIAPSPTGFMHIGGLYAALISERLAHQTEEGIFYLRIEDTDRKRELSGAEKLIVESLHHYGINPDEGQTLTGEEVGAYGPYKQSERAEIYHAYIKMFLESGLAYPCFATPEELDEMRTIQEAQGVRPGYYGAWAKWRSKSKEEVLQALAEGKQFVVRFKSHGDFDHKIIVPDILRGNRELAENEQDIVIMKSDGLPTYHFAHVIDDHLMGTTHVLRGDEWLSSTPLHLQLFAALHWEPPKYGHIAPIQKMEDTSRRKLSKRKDPEANVAYYDEQGYPINAVIEYLLNLANSTFEDWRKANPEKDNREFKLSLERISASGALFDFTKLNDISKEIIATYSAADVYQAGLAWAKKYDAELAQIMEQHEDYTKRILSIERGGDPKRARKDIFKWAGLKEEIGYFFDELFHPTNEQIKHELAGITNVPKIVAAFAQTYDEHDDKDTWFNKIKKLAVENGYAENAKAYKAEPNKYLGNVADVAKVFRVLLTGKPQTPDLHAIMQVMGKKRVMGRIMING